jgi:hypothetical protein
MSRRRLIMRKWRRCWFSGCGFAATRQLDPTLIGLELWRQLRPDDFEAHLDARL